MYTTTTYTALRPTKSRLEEEWTSPNIAPRQQSTIFLGTGDGSGVHPRSLLLLAGDIETNPGPSREIDALDTSGANPESSVNSAERTLDYSREHWVESERLDSNRDTWDCSGGNQDTVGNSEIMDTMRDERLNSFGVQLDSGGGNRELGDIPLTEGDETQPNTISESGEEEEVNDVLIRVLCISCNSRLRKHYSPFFCVAPGCIAVCHRQEMCSGLSRTEQKKGGWRCHLHGGKDLRRTESMEPKEQESLGKCVECDKTLKSGISPIVCSDCSNLSHASCTKMSRDDILRKRDGKLRWICSPCCNVEDNIPGSKDQAPLEKGSCCKCKKAICRGVERMRCNKCSKESHKGCTGLTRDAYQALIYNNAWMCEQCDYSAPPGSDSIPTGQARDGAGPRKTGAKRNLRGLQWNADGLNTKVAELNKLVVELDVDVVLIQETKLTSR